MNHPAILAKERRISCDMQRVRFGWCFHSFIFALLYKCLFRGVNALVNQRRFVLIKRSVIENDCARLRNSVWNYFVSKARQALPCPANGTCLVAVLPNAVAVSVSANHDLRNRLAGSGA